MGEVGSKGAVVGCSGMYCSIAVEAHTCAMVSSTTAPAWLDTEGPPHADRVKADAPSTGGRAARPPCCPPAAVQRAGTPQKEPVQSEAEVNRKHCFATLLCPGRWHPAPTHPAPPLMLPDQGCHSHQHPPWSRQNATNRKLIRSGARPCVRAPPRLPGGCAAPLCSHSSYTRPNTEGDGKNRMQGKLWWGPGPRIRHGHVDTPPPSPLHRLGQVAKRRWTSRILPATPAAAPPQAHVSHTDAQVPGGDSPAPLPHQTRREIGKCIYLKSLPCIPIATTSLQGNPSTSGCTAAPSAPPSPPPDEKRTNKCANKDLSPGRWSSPPSPAALRWGHSCQWPSLCRSAVSTFLTRAMAVVSSGWRLRQSWGE